MIYVYTCVSTQASVSDNPSIHPTDRQDTYRKLNQAIINQITTRHFNGYANRRSLLQDDCAKRGGALVMVASVEETDALLDAVQKKMSSKYIGILIVRVPSLLSVENK